MDPNAALENMRAAISDYDSATVAGHEWDAEEAAQRVVDAARALDEWLSKGGFLPSDWERKA